MTDTLLEAVIAHTRLRGAMVVEAYPVHRDSPSYRFTGFVGLFDRAGFKRIGVAGTRRHVLRLKVV